MLWTILVILVVLWLLGLASSSTLGGFIPLLLVIAVIVRVMQLMQGRTPPVEQAVDDPPRSAAPRLVGCSPGRMRGPLYRRLGRALHSNDEVRLPNP
jgi:Family of unknown function (DUF5670)